MLAWLREIDELLRGNKSDPKLLAKGTDHFRLAPLIGVPLVLGLIYGLCMGLYSVMTREPACLDQMWASVVKVPALFFLTLLVTLPSLYVFSALKGARLQPLAVMRVMLAATAVNLAVLASFGPILAFFTVSTSSYHFMKLLNVLFFAIGGFVSLGFLMKLLNGLEKAMRPPEEAVPAIPVEPQPSEMEQVAEGYYVRRRKQPSSTAAGVFKVWLMLYALVGAQMGWILRPFIGAPDLEFTWFRAREANIFIDIAHSLEKLLGM